jgi:L-alanine-DL-glutamate epimerase-like enolase superfamily enzyme
LVKTLWIYCGIDSIGKNGYLQMKLPWPIYKIKLGIDDIAIVKALRKHTKAIFRIDANCGWSVNETIQMLLKKKLGVEFLEQPLQQMIGMDTKVFKHAALPIIADESVLSKQMSSVTSTFMV